MRHRRAAGAGHDRAYGSGGMPLRSAWHISVTLLGLAETLPLHVLVGNAEKLVGSIGRIVADGMADAALDLQGQTAVKGQLIQLLLNAIEDDSNIFLRGFNQQRGELVAAVTRYKIRGAARLQQSIGHGAQHVVAYGVTKAVVDLFEVQYVEHDKQNTRSSALGTGSEPAIRLM